MPKNYHYYLPMADDALKAWAGKVCYRSGDPQENVMQSDPIKQPLAKLATLTGGGAAKNVLYVIVHGAESSPDLIGAQISKEPELWRKENYEWLAEDLIKNGLPAEVRVTLKLLACWGGDVRRSWSDFFAGKAKRSLASQLYEYLALKKHYNRLIVYGYHGAILQTTYHQKHHYVNQTEKKIDADTIRALEEKSSDDVELAAALKKEGIFIRKGQREIFGPRY